MGHLVKIFQERMERCRIIRENKDLCERYPFLIPWNRWSGDPVPDYDYSYTELDNMPVGWRRAFGLRMCEDLRNALIDDNDLDRWRIVQLKEKYGSLRLYDNAHKKDSQVPFIINKYEDLSMRTCIQCGAPATRMTTGWISPYCDKCCPSWNSVPIDEYFKEDEGI